MPTAYPEINPRGIPNSTAIHRRKRVMGLGHILSSKISYCPVKLGTLFSMKAWRASCASYELAKMPDAFEVNTMVVSMELSRAARMIRLLVH